MKPFPAQVGVFNLKWYHVMQNEFLNSLCIEMESDVIQIDADEVMNVALEAAQVEVDVLVGLMESLESNYVSFVSRGEVTMESYRQYEHNADMILKAAGLEIPVGVIVPSFESAQEDPAADVKEKKENVIKRAAKALYKAFMILVNKIRDFFTRKSENVKKLEESLKKADAVVNIIRLKKPTPVTVDLPSHGAVANGEFILSEKIDAVIACHDRRLKVLSTYKKELDNGAWDNYHKEDDALDQAQKKLNKVLVETDPSIIVIAKIQNLEDGVADLSFAVRKVKEVLPKCKEFARRFNDLLKAAEKIPEESFSIPQFPTEVNRVVKEINSDFTSFNKILDNYTVSFDRSVVDVKKAFAL